MKQAFATVIVLLTACVAAVGQQKPLEVQSQPPVNAGDMSSQAVSPSEAIPRFHTEAREVVLGATVFKPIADKRKPDEALVPRGVLKHSTPGFAAATIEYAKKLDDSLTLSDFHVFDDGAEQRINYFRKSTSPLKDVSGVWLFSPTSRGTWGIPPPDTTYAFNGLTVKYVIGYVPPEVEAGKCHEVRVVVEGRRVELDRNSYCAAASDDLDEATREETEVGKKMRSFADSEKRGSIKVSARAFVFWSSRVLSLVNQSLAIGSTAPPASDLTYAVKVHDSQAPATVHIAVQFVPPWEHWDPGCSEKGTLHMLGIAYGRNHKVAGQFGVTYACDAIWRAAIQHPFGLPTLYFLIPARFDAQMELAPGDYYLRVVVSDGKKRFGVARVPLHVESFDGQQLALSDIVLSSFPRDASKVLDDAVIVSPGLLVPTPLVSKNSQFIPDTETHVRQQNQFPIYFEIYEPLLKQQTTEVYMHLRVTEVKTGLIFQDLGLLSAANWVQPGNPVIPVGFSLDIHKLDAGDYQVEVQVSDAPGRKSAWRQAKFTIDE